MAVIHAFKTRPNGRILGNPRVLSSCPAELTAIVAPSLEIDRLRQTFRDVATNIPGAQLSTDYVLVITTCATEYHCLTCPSHFLIIFIKLYQSYTTINIATVFNSQSTVSITIAIDHL